MWQGVLFYSGRRTGEEGEGDKGRHEEERKADISATGPPASVKRKQALQSIIKALQTLASTRNCAVVLLSQCATHMQQSGRGATLTPAVNTALWEQGVSTRLVLFRDWTLGPPELGKTRDRYYAPGFLAGVQKLDGRHAHEGLEHVSAFEVGSVSTTTTNGPGQQQMWPCSQARLTLGHRTA